MIKRVIFCLLLALLFLTACGFYVEVFEESSGTRFVGSVPSEPSEPPQPTVPDEQMIRLVENGVASVAIVYPQFDPNAKECAATILQSIFMMFAFIVVFQLMGGLFTPIASMPQWAQYITYAIPPRYFIEIMRAVYLKGATMADLWPQYAALTGFALLFCLVASLTYKKRT